MKIIDLHTDTLTREEPEKADLFSSSKMLSYDKMILGNYDTVALAVYLNYEKHKGHMFELAKKYFDALDRIIELHPEKFCYYGNKSNAKIKVLRTIEEGEEIEGKIENLEYFYNRGLKMMTLTWNYPNSLAYPNNTKDNKPELNQGLTNTGKKVIEYLNDKHILLDVSHLGDKAFYECSKLYHGPIVASHSNARSLTKVVRNLEDDMIRIIRDSGGIIGINLCEYFVKTESKSYLDSLVDHIEYIKRIGGIDVLSIGSDFDGISVPPDLIDCSKWNILQEKLLFRGWSEEDIDKLFYKNAERVLNSY